MIRKIGIYNEIKNNLLIFLLSLHRFLRFIYSVVEY